MWILIIYAIFKIPFMGFQVTSSIYLFLLACKLQKVKFVDVTYFLKMTTMSAFHWACMSILFDAYFCPWFVNSLSWWQEKTSIGSSWENSISSPKRSSWCLLQRVRPDGSCTNTDYGRTALTSWEDLLMFYCKWTRVYGLGDGYWFWKAITYTSNDLPGVYCKGWDHMDWRRSMIMSPRGTDRSGMLRGRKVEERGREKV